MIKKKKNVSTRTVEINLEDALKMVRAGMTTVEIAKHYKTTRGTVSRCLNPTPKEGYTLRMTYMHKDRPCTLIDVNFLEKKVHILNRTDDMLHRAFGVVENPTWEDFECFVRERCFPATRGNVDQLLKTMNLTDYDPLQIIEKTKGRMAEDHMWLSVKYYQRKGIKHYELY